MSDTTKGLPQDVISIDMWVAADWKAKPEVLANYAKSKYWQVRAETAANPATPSDSRRMLLNDPVPDVRAMALDSPKTTLAEISLMLNDNEALIANPKDTVRQSAMRALERLKKNLRG